MARIIPLKPYTHMCPPSVWKRKGVCPLCEEHKVKLTKHMRASRFRAKVRKGIVK